MSNKKSKIVVAISGSGRTLANLIREQPKMDYEISGVITNTRECVGFDIASGSGLPILVSPFANQPLGDFTETVYSWIKSIGAEWVVLAGFLKKFPIKPNWNGKIINIHPALLPKYGGPGMYGAKVHKAVLKAQDQISGATVHFVTNEYDQGQIIANSKVSVHDNDDYRTLAKRVFESECRMYPDVVSRLIDGSLPLQKEKIQEYQS